MKNIDWKAVLPITGIGVVAGIAIGAFLVAPKLAKAKAAKKKDGDKSKEGTAKKA